MLSSGLRLLPRAISGSMVLQQSGSGLTHVATKHQGQMSHLSPRLVSEDQDASRYEWPELILSVMVTSRSELQLRAMSGSMDLQQPRSVLMSDAPVTIEDRVDNRD